MTACACDVCPAPNLSPIADVLAQLRAEAQRLPHPEVLQLPLLAACGAVLAEDIQAGINVPPADNSAMDGYVVNAAYCADGGLLPVSQRIAAGEAGEPLQPGTCARIFTGAPLPPEADAVIAQEQVEVLADGRVRLPPVKSGSHVRRAGEDIGQGATLLKQGQRLRPADLGLLASCGVAQVKVYRRLRIAVLSTGNELCEPWQTLEAGQLYDSNKYLLLSQLDELGFDVFDAGTLSDSLSLTQERLEDLAAQFDLIITTGGVSVGEEDHIKAAIEHLGELLLWKLAIKPGKPLAYGYVTGTPVFALPGNPVAAAVTLLLTVVPWLRWRQGEHYNVPEPVSLPAQFAWRAGPRREYLRVRVEEASLVRFDHQGSGVLSSMSWADGLAYVEPNVDVAVGDSLPYVSFAQLLA
ncbi:molybdopterin molybdotransferase MoeA [Atopomonas sediminilitoris]|uniref:molybdopterin molybdotransferase MoeA n=1 Tax=Atopomonas sediminilitoris TaxID=2919919 RepID=UPI001F4DC9BD|nr:gephyrin-like molybdotransferase Glp [Atopomonas sediminilitoris]MCJ8169141.1 molybdopterin molybdotransferase MoeA [Atopomonas sediminilitoris]